MAAAGMIFLGLFSFGIEVYVYTVYFIVRLFNSSSVLSAALPCISIAVLSDISLLVGASHRHASFSTLQAFIYKEMELDRGSLIWELY